jgi:hypothetical protein
VRAGDDRVRQPERARHGIGPNVVCGGPSRYANLAKLAGFAHRHVNVASFAHTHANVAGFAHRHANSAVSRRCLCHA